MKGGYQILDLTGATAGSPVEVKGIYKAAAGNNGKPVLILTNDGQRVYAEIAEDDGDYVTCYISAEGKTVNITIEPDDLVTTVLSDTGASITGLEQAVNELNDNKAAKSDITDLVCIGTKNTTGSTIPASKYFYLNNVLCKAKTDIDNDTDFTLNTNYEEVTIDEELSALNSNLNDKGIAINNDYFNISVYKVDKIKCLIVSSTKVALTEGTSYSCGTLPEKYRPSSTRIVQTIIGNTRQYTFDIYTSGGISITPLSTMPDTAANVYCALTYV